jgi:anthranilate phosphoribosyltransferase
LRRTLAADTHFNSLEALTMPTQNEGRVSGDFNFYAPQYARFGSALAAELRWFCQLSGKVAQRTGV